MDFDLEWVKVEFVDIEWFIVEVIVGVCLMVVGVWVMMLVE